MNTGRAQSMTWCNAVGKPNRGHHTAPIFAPFMLNGKRIAQVHGQGDGERIRLVMTG
jgi:hypothetical protein